MPGGANDNGGGAWALEAVAQVIDRFAGGLDADQTARDRAYRRALTLLDDRACGDDTRRVASIGFACDVLADLAAELGTDLPSLGTLIQRLETDAKLSLVELGRELLRAPQLLRLLPRVGIDVVLNLLRAFMGADVVSLWRLSSAGHPDPIASTGDTRTADVRARWIAQDLLAGQPLHHPSGSDVAGVSIDCTHGTVALVSRRSVAGSGRDLLLLEAAIPVLTAALERDASLSDSPVAVGSPNPRSDHMSSAERRLARLRFDLHDGPQQDLVLLAEDLRLFRSQLDSVLAGDEMHDLVLGRFDDFEAQLIAVDGDIRQISVSVESPFLHGELLPEAIAQVTGAFQQRTGIRPQIRLAGDFSDLTDSQHITLLGLIREALANIRKHADAEHVTISVAADASGVKASVTDDGRGFNPQTRLVQAARDGHLGVVGMHERARMLGGDTHIDSCPDGPTVISVNLPPAPLSVPRRAR